MISRAGIGPGPMPSIDELAVRARRRPDRYEEFLRVPAMSAGVYVLSAGAEDLQSPHEEDEVYYVVRGRSRFRRGNTEVPVASGDILFVPAHEPHRFLSIEEELVLLVVFAPAEQTSAASAAHRSSPPSGRP
jgi:mannose-6-phosphate isomerase-like protein (cupin superfamily)